MKLKTLILSLAAAGTLMAATSAMASGLDMVVNNQTADSSLTILEGTPLKDKEAAPHALTTVNLIEAGREHPSCLVSECTANIYLVDSSGNQTQIATGTMTPHGISSVDLTVTALPGHSIAFTNGSSATACTSTASPNKACSVTVTS